MRMNARGRSVFAAVVTAIAVASALPATAAAEPPVPVASPPASLTQRVGITDFKIEWNSPAMKGRKIFGGLVEHGKVWRTGANEVTRLTASHEFTFGDRKVPAGTYALFTIPGKNEWTVILNSDTGAWGAYSYDEKKDVARTKVKPQKLGEKRERLTFAFRDTTEKSAALDLEWENVRVAIPLSVDTNAHVLAGIESVVKEGWRPHNVAAAYLLESDGDMERALKLVETSIAVQETWRNQWVKAQILGRTGKKADARKAALRASELGKGDRVFDNFIRPAVDEAIKGWK